MIGCRRSGRQLRRWKDSAGISQSRTTTRRGCYHELQQLRVTRSWIRRHQQPRLRPASLRPRASRWLRVQAFPTTHSRISTRSLHHLLPHPLLASPTPSPASFITDSLNSTPTKPLLPAASSVSASAPLQPDCPLRYRPYLSDPHCDFPDMVKWRPQRVAPRHWVSIGRFSRNGHHVLQQQHPALTTTTTSSSSTTSSTNCQDGGCNLFAVTLSTS